MDGTFHGGAVDVTLIASVSTRLPRRSNPRKLRSLTPGISATFGIVQVVMVGKLTGYEMPSEPLIVTTMVATSAGAVPAKSTLSPVVEKLLPPLVVIVRRVWG